MLNNLKLTQFEHSSSTTAKVSQSNKSAHRQKASTGLKLHEDQKSQKIKSIVRLIQDKQYWNIFYAFKKMTISLKPYQIRKVRANYIKKILYRHLPKRDQNSQLMQRGFNQFRNNIKIQRANENIVERATYIIINQRYKEMAKFFSIFKDLPKSKSQSFMELMSKSEEIETKKKKEKKDNKLEQIMYWNKINSKLLACKQIKSTLTFVLERSINQHFWQKLQSTLSLYNKNNQGYRSFSFGSFGSTQQKTKFTKKTSQLNQIQVLSKIVINGIQMEHIQKSSYEFLAKINQFQLRQKFKIKKQFIVNLKQKFLPLSEHKQITQAKDKSQQENMMIYTDVLSTLCYLSKQTYIKYMQKIPKKKHKEYHLHKLFSTIKKKQVYHLYYSFGSIKLQNFNYKISLLQKIQQLQKMKQELCELFDETENQEQFQMKQQNY